MNLIGCHIENFGKLSHCDLDFEKGCNVISKKNGWGKSTLMAFLRVMLYGFANESKRSGLENERKRFKPWQGGVYGGSLTFEAGGRIYCCYRVFGEKEKEDQFRLLDCATNLETDDFSERLGEELFQIDQDSFFKSAYIGQLKSDIQYAGATGSMSAKLGGLMEETGDIGRFEAVDKKLADLLNRMSPRRATGSLYKQKKELEEYSFQIGKKAKIEQTVAEIREKRREESGRKELLEAERAQINAKQKQLVLQEKKKRHQSLVGERDHKREEYESVRNYFPKELPDKTELERQIKTAAEMEENRSAMEIYALSPEEERELKGCEDQFGVCGPPKKGEINEIREAIQRWRGNQEKLNAFRVSEEDIRKLEAYRSRFSDEPPKEEELERRIRDWEKRNQKKEALTTKQASLNMARMIARQAREAAAREAALEAKAARAAAAKEAEAAAKKSGNTGILLFASLLMGAVGIFLLNKQLGMIGIFLGIVCIGLPAVAAVVYGGRRKREIKRTSQEPEGSLSGEGENDFIYADTAGEEDETVRRLEREIGEDEGFICETEEKIRRYLEIYNMEWEEYGISDELHQLKNDVREYKNILEREKRYRQQEKECSNDGLQRRIEEFLDRYGVLKESGTGEYGELLQRLIGDAEKYRKLKENKEHYTQRIRAYERQKEELHRYLEKMSLEPEEDLYAQLLEFQKRLGICMDKRQALQAAERALEEYETKEDVGAFLNGQAEEITETADQLYERQNEISRQLARVQDNIHAYSLQLEENGEKIERINEQELLLEELKEAYEAGQKKYDHLVKTRDYLKIAKERLTEKYMAPLTNGFRKYYGIVTGGDAKGYRLDANASLTFEEQGFLRQPELLSTGYRDIAGLCMRMALIDAMYQDDAPFILMDDPFVNYDAQNLRGGMEFIKKVSETYQIIYFTCR